MLDLSTEPKASVVISAEEDNFGNIVNINLACAS